MIESAKTATIRHGFSPWRRAYSTARPKRPMPTILPGPVPRSPRFTFGVQPELLIRSLDARILPPATAGSWIRPAGNRQSSRKLQDAPLSIRRRTEVAAIKGGRHGA